MELQRGICNLCLESGKVLTSSDAEEFCKFLPDILHNNFLTENKFQEIKSQLKICSLCCYKVQAANEIRQDLQNFDENNKVHSTTDSCYFCETDKCLLQATNNWKYFIERTEGFLKTEHLPVNVCPRCLFYFDAVFDIKTKLRSKFPQLGRPAKKKRIVFSPNATETTKRKSISKVSPISKKQKICNNCFSYLQPLSNNMYQVNAKHKADTRLYKKIPYVNLTNASLKKDGDREHFGARRIRPTIKIKLKPKVRSPEQEFSTIEILQYDVFTPEDSFKSEPFIKLLKSQNITNNASKDEEEKQSSSKPDQSESEDKVETLKTPTAVPKRRRLSFHAAELDGSKDKDGSSNENAKDSSESSDEYIKESSESSDEYVKDTSETSEEYESLPEENIVERNGIEDNEEAENQEMEQSENTNGHQQHDGSGSSEASEEFGDKVLELSDDERRTPNKESLEGDSLNGSERKKKRVTFSDDS